MSLARIRKKLEGSGANTAAYNSIAEPLDQLRQRVISDTDDSIARLTRLSEVAADLKTAEEAEDEGVLADLQTRTSGCSPASSPSTLQRGRHLARHPRQGNERAPGRLTLTRPTLRSARSPARTACDEHSTFQNPDIVRP